MRTRLSALVCAVTLALGLFTALLWNRNFALGARCDALQKDNQRLRVENEQREAEAISLERLATPGAPGGLADAEGGPR